jgi:enoyl-CoA hydratase/carnithine racemase
MLLTNDHGTIREITLNRPPANAINDELARSLGEALVAASENAEAVIVSGLPGMFSAGLDVPSLLQLDRSNFSEYWLNFQVMLRNLAYMPIPTVFAMTGHAPAGGIVMALFGDYRIMPKGGFKTGLNEVQVGLVAPPPAQHALVRLVGAHTAERILVAGEMMDSEKALEIGLVDELTTDAGEVVPRALEWCEQLLALPRHAMLTTRQMTRESLHAAFAGDLEKQTADFADLWFKEDTQRTLKTLVARLKK